jgi:CheY-like chemotaxis protein
MILSTLYGRFIEVWRQKEAIVQKNRITRLLIRNAGHEVRTPLSSIINYLEVALEETLDERARFHLERSLQASKSLVFVINDLLNLTEAEDSDFDVFESNLDLRSLIYEVISAFSHETAKKKIDVVLEDDQSVPRIVRSDPAGLRQVVSNLLSNAIAHSAGSDIVIGLNHLATTETTNLIEISFQDKGVGLSEEQLDAIFQDFEKIIDDDDGAEKTNPDLTSESDGPQKSCFGIGVGLATAGRFVRLNQGQISIFSPGLGQGTRVALRIPFTKDFQSDYQKSVGPTSISVPATSAGQLLSQIKVIPSPSPSTGSGPGSKSPNTSSKDLTSSSVLGTTPMELDPPGSSSNSNVVANRYPFSVTSTWKAKPKFNILIAEDNPLNSRLLENRLTKAGHTVYLAVDGAACFSAFKDNSAIFDVILMDIQASSLSLSCYYFSTLRPHP